MWTEEINRWKGVGRNPEKKFAIKVAREIRKEFFRNEKESWQKRREIHKQGNTVQYQIIKGIIHSKEFSLRIAGTIWDATIFGNFTVIAEALRGKRYIWDVLHPITRVLYLACGTTGIMKYSPLLYSAIEWNGFHIPCVSSLADIQLHDWLLEDENNIYLLYFVFGQVINRTLFGYMKWHHYLMSKTAGSKEIESKTRL